MKYTTEEALTEIMRRKNQIVLRRSRRSCQVLSGVSAMLMVFLLLVICMMPGSPGSAFTGTVYGSFLLSAESGGYVLAAVIAFVLGVCVTLLCLKIGNKRKAQSFNSTMTGRE